LQKYNIEYCEPQSGIFVFINLSPFLKEKSIQGEMNLYRKFLNSSKLNISPGHLFHAPEPGWFRICYAVNQQMLNEGIKRLIKTLAL
jgi:1-aminocyclopropane-1-carboxylate synthase